MQITAKSAGIVRRFFLGLIFDTFTVVLWGRIGFDSDSGCQV